MRQIFNFIYILFSIIVFLDLNEFLLTVFNSGKLLSNLILIMTFILLFLNKSTWTNSVKNGRLYSSYKYHYFFYLMYGSIITILLFNIEVCLEQLRYIAPGLMIFLASYYSFLNLSRNGYLYFAVNNLLFLMSISSFLILYSVIFNYDFLGSDSLKVERALGLFTNPNRAGNLCCFSQVFTVFYFLKIKSNKWDNYLITLYFVHILAAFSTFSKTAIILTVLIFALMLIMRKGVRNQSRYSSSLKKIRVFGLISLVFFIFNFSKLSSGFTKNQADRYDEVILILGGEVSDRTTTNRTSLANEALNEISDNYIIGKGLGAISIMKSGTGAHNQYLVYLGEVGIFGLFLYLYFLFTWFSNAKRQRRDVPMFFLMFGCLVIFVSIGFTSHNMLTFKPLLFFIGALFAICNLNFKLDNL